MTPKDAPKDSPKDQEKPTPPPQPPAKPIKVEPLQKGVRPGQGKKG